MSILGNSIINYYMGNTTSMKYNILTYQFGVMAKYITIKIKQH